MRDDTRRIGLRAIAFLRNYYVRRILRATATFLLGMFVVFALYRLMPGGPLDAMMTQMVQQMRQEQGHVDMARIAHRAKVLTGIDPSKPIPLAYYGYLKDIIIHQDFGQSIAYSDPVFKILFKAMPWSIFISVYGLFLGYTSNILIGALMAYRQGTRTDSSLTVFVLVMNSVPYFVVAIVLLSLVGFQWHLLPTGGRYPSQATPGFNLEFMIGMVRHSILPIGSSFIVGFAGGSLQMRGNAISIMGSDYLRLANIRGLSTNRILTRYLTRNAILPIYTSIIIGISALFSSSVITERIFQYPGVGWYTFEALQYQDYPLLMGAFIFFALLTILGTLIADFTYGLIDPRAGTGDQRESY
ncbi:ABC transporter permease [Halarchaeum sp. P4]|uniref:ABC transporter permease n=1 Tax=Halarchaeum sp. P4 TaxID=3421639 RepID=UPI003EB784FC